MPQVQPKALPIPQVGVPPNPYGKPLGGPPSAPNLPLIWLPQMIDQARQGMRGYWEGLDPVIPPGTPFGGLKRSAGQAAQVLSAPGFGMADLLGIGATGVGAIPAMLAQEGGNFLSQTFGTTYQDPRLQLQPSQPLPGMPQSPIEQAQTDSPFSLPGLDQSFTFQGAPLPAPPVFKAPPSITPDYSKTDALYESARPQVHEPKQTKTGAFLEGIGLAAGQVNPQTPWPTALAQILSGGTQGMRELRMQQEESELRHEAEMRQYSLLRAGVEEQRATAAAQQEYNRLKLEMDLTQRNWENAWEVSKAQDAKMQVNSDGSMVVTQRDPQGKLTVQKLGFDDALKINLAIAQAKAIQGKSGEFAVRQEILKKFGPWAQVGASVMDAIGANIEADLLPPNSPVQESYRRMLDDALNEYTARGIKGKDLENALTMFRQQALMTIISSDSSMRDYVLHNLGFGVARQAQPAQPALKPPPNPFYHGDLLPQASE